SAALVEAIANFVRVRRRNPGHNLRFRFFTNAGDTSERGVDFVGGLTGVQAWNGVRSGLFVEPQRTGILHSLRQALLPEAGRQLTDDQQEIARFISAVDDDALVAQLIDRFEISVGNPPVERLQSTVEELLRGHNLASTLAEAKE